MSDRANLETGGNPLYQTPIDIKASAVWVRNSKFPERVKLRHYEELLFQMKRQYSEAQKIKHNREIIEAVCFIALMVEESIVVEQNHSSTTI
jgi:hypothetical protein